MSRVIFEQNELLLLLLKKVHALRKEWILQDDAAIKFKLEQQIKALEESREKIIDEIQQAEAVYEASTLNIVRDLERLLIYGN